MKIKYLGTAAAEGIPAVFCDCERCCMARAAGGKEIRMRSGALIDGVLKLDFGPDTYAGMLRFGLSFAELSHILITHSHEDHFTPQDICYIHPPYSHRKGALHVYGNERVGEGMMGCDGEKLTFTRVRPFESFEAAGYRVTPLEAVHAQGEEALFYRVEKDGKAVLYAHDTDEFTEADMAYLEGKHHDLISLDCTNGELELDYIGHMGAADNLRMRERLMKIGAADEKTIFVANHFSHNGVVPIGELENLLPGFVIAFDGMEISV